MLPLYGYACEVDKMYKQSYLSMYQDKKYNIVLSKTVMMGGHRRFKVIQHPRCELECLKQFKTCKEGLDFICELNPYSEDVWVVKKDERFGLYIRSVGIVNMFNTPSWQPVLSESFFELIEQWRGTLSSATEHYKHINDDGVGCLYTI